MSMMMMMIGTTHTHPLNRPCLGLGLPGWAGTRKVKPIWILLKQVTVSGSGIRWVICKSAARFRQITTPAPHPLSFLQARCPSCWPTNSVKALKARSVQVSKSICIAYNNQESQCAGPYILTTKNCKREKLKNKNSLYWR